MSKSSKVTVLTRYGMRSSMSRRGDCWDNAAMKSFFSTLEAERANRRRYATRDEVLADVFDYIGRFYNPRRRHSTLSQVSPDEFENDVVPEFRHRLKDEEVEIYGRANRKLLRQADTSKVELLARC